MASQNENKIIASLLKTGARVVNFGMKGFYDDLRAQDIPVTQMDWAPKTANKDLLAKLKALKKT